MLAQDRINEFLNSLGEAIPEYRYEVENSVRECEGYLLLDEFALFVQRRIDEDPTSDVVLRCLTFIDTAFHDADNEIQEWIQVTFLESMLQGSTYIDFIKSRLSGNTLQCFDKMLTSGHWRINL